MILCAQHASQSIDNGNRMKRIWSTSLPLLLLFLAAWLPRGLALDRFVTADERRWLTRSANFDYAISHGDWAHTFQREHPGVTIMWAGTLGLRQEFPDYAQQSPGQFGWEDESLEAWLLDETAHTPLALLAAGRRWVALMISLLIAAAYFPLRRLFGAPVAALATLFIAWDPFYVALSRQLHPDGLVTAFITLALLHFLGWLYGERRHYLVSGGVLLGLACLTKTPAVFLISAAGLLVVIELVRSAMVAGGRRLALVTRHLSLVDEEQSLAPRPATHAQDVGLRSRLLLGAVAWGVLAAATFVALWPAMWVQPVATLQSMVMEMSTYVEGHVNPNFFWGEVTADPGALFYPVAYWFRTTPATLLGLMIAGLFAWRRGWPMDQPVVRRAALALLLFALVFTIGMTLGSKKFDRYLLPAFPALDILAALGWASLAYYVLRLLDGWKLPQFTAHRVALSACLLIALSFHALPGLTHYPYYLTYYNPLAGGGEAANKRLMVGWGEGLDQAAAWLNQQPDSTSASVVAWYGDGPLSYFLQSRAPLYSFWSPEFWLDADYAVVYISQQQRHIPTQEASDYFAGLPPAYVVTIGGLEMAHIYDLRNLAPPAFTGLSVDSAGPVGNGMRLAGYAMGERSFLAGNRFLVRLYLDSRCENSTDDVATVRLIDAAGRELWRSDQMLDPRLSASGMLVYDHEIVIPTAVASGAYDLTLSVHEWAVAAPHERLITSINVEAAKQVALELDWGLVQLTEVEVQPVVEAGAVFLVDLDATGQVDGSLKISSRLVDEDGVVVAQADELLTANTHVELPVPTETTPGAYQLYVVVYDPETLEPFPDGLNEFLTLLTTVDIKGDG